MNNDEETNREEIELSEASGNRPLDASNSSIEEGGNSGGPEEISPEPEPDAGDDGGDDGNGGNTDETTVGDGDPEFAWGKYSPALITVFALVVIISSFFFAFWSSDSALEVATWAVVAEAEVDPDLTPPSVAGGNAEQPPTTLDSWLLQGRVMRDGSAVEGAEVWAVATDRLGNRFSPPPKHSDADGGFKFDAIPRVIRFGSGEFAAEVEVNAKACVPTNNVNQKPGTCPQDDTIQKTLRGSDTTTLSETSTSRNISIPAKAFLPIPVIFFMVILVAISQVHERYRKWKYYGSVVLAFLFTFVILAYVIIGMTKISDIGSPGEVLNVGFLQFVHGSYVVGGDSNWLVSITSTVSDSESPAPGSTAAATGLGAPLWVIFMSVVGSSAYTLLLLVRQAGRQVQFKNAKLFRKTQKQITMHQVYLMFAPLGAIIVYQMMVIGEAAAKDVSVGIVALGSGLTLNWILAVSSEKIGDLFDRTTKDSDDDDDEILVNGIGSGLAP